MPVILKGKLIDKSDPAICVSIRKTTQQQILAAAYSLERAGVKVVEWRADCFEGLLDETVFYNTLTSLSRIFKDIVFILTIRSKDQGGTIDIGQAGMKRILSKVAVARLCDCIDIEYFYYDDAKEIIEKIQSTGTAVILSHHIFDTFPDYNSISNILDRMEEADPDILKIAINVNNKDELDLIGNTVKARADCSLIPYVFIGMGEAGYDSRLYPMDYSSALSFAAMDGDEQFGQISYTQMIAIRGI